MTRIVKGKKIEGIEAKIKAFISDQWKEAEKEEKGVKSLKCSLNSFIKQFENYDAENKTITASSMDIHEDFQKACYEVAKTLKAMPEAEFIPAIKGDCNGHAIFTALPMKFYDVFYKKNEDAEKRTANAKATRAANKAKKAEEEKLKSEEEKAKESLSTLHITKDNINFFLAELIKQNSDAVDFTALQIVIDSYLKQAKKPKKENMLIEKIA